MIEVHLGTYIYLVALHAERLQHVLHTRSKQIISYVGQILPQLFHESFFILGQFRMGPLDENKYKSKKEVTNKNAYHCETFKRQSLHCLLCTSIPVIFLLFSLSIHFLYKTWPQSKIYPRTDRLASGSLFWSLLACPFPNTAQLTHDSLSVKSLPSVSV
jgi:hypothetical protein